LDSLSGAALSVNIQEKLEVSVLGGVRRNKRTKKKKKKKKKKKSERKCERHV